MGRLKEEALYLERMLTSKKKLLKETVKRKTSNLSKAQNSKQRSQDEALYLERMFASKKTPTTHRKKTVKRKKTKKPTLSKAQNSKVNRRTVSECRRSGSAPKQSKSHVELKRPAEQSEEIHWI